MISQQRGKLVLQMQDLSFLGKLNFRFLAFKKHQMSRQFQTEIMKVKWFRQNITLSKH